MTSGSNASFNPPNHILIRVLVVLDSNGYPTYTYADNSTGNNVKILGKVNPGDIVGWHLQLKPFERPWTFPPYTLTFQDPSFFQTDSLEVADGGYSTYLPVRSVAKHGKTEYTVTVQGISPNDDPEIQTDQVSGGGIEGVHLLQKEVVRQGTITWDGVDGSHPSIVWNGGPPSDATTQINTVNPGDLMTFTLNPVGSGNFRVVVFSVYPVKLGIDSPFEDASTTSITPIPGTNGTTDALPAATDTATFKFVLYFVSDDRRSAHFTLDVENKPKPCPVPAD
jgi:hypothetical protein